MIYASPFRCLSACPKKKENCVPGGGDRDKVASESICHGYGTVLETSVSASLFHDIFTYMRMYVKPTKRVGFPIVSSNLDPSGVNFLLESFSDNSSE